MPPVNSSLWKVRLSHEFFLNCQIWHFCHSCTKLTSRGFRISKKKITSTGYWTHNTNPTIRIPAPLPTQPICQSMPASNFQTLLKSCSIKPEMIKVQFMNLLFNRCLGGWVVKGAGNLRVSSITLIAKDENENVLSVGGKNCTVKNLWLYFRIGNYIPIIKFSYSKNDSNWAIVMLNIQTLFLNLKSDGTDHLLSVSFISSNGWGKQRTESTYQCRWHHQDQSRTFLFVPQFRVSGWLRNVCHVVICSLCRNHPTNTWVAKVKKGKRFKLCDIILWSLPAKMCQSHLLLLISHCVFEKILMSSFCWLAQKKWYRKPLSYFKWNIPFEIVLSVNAWESLNYDVGQPLISLSRSYPLYYPV